MLQAIAGAVHRATTAVAVASGSLALASALASRPIAVGTRLSAAASHKCVTRERLVLWAKMRPNIIRGKSAAGLAWSFALQAGLLSDAGVDIRATLLILRVGRQGRGRTSRRWQR